MVTIACRSVVLRNEMKVQPGDLKYDDSDFIGSGGFAEVFKAVMPRNEQEMVVAVKKPNIGGSRFTDEYVAVNWTVLSVLMTFNPNILVAVKCTN